MTTTQAEQWLHEFFILFNIMLQILKISLIKWLRPGKWKRKVALSSLAVRQSIPKLKDFLPLFMHKFRAGSALRSSVCILRWMPAPLAHTFSIAMEYACIPAGGAIWAVWGTFRRQSQSGRTAWPYLFSPCFLRINVITLLPAIPSLPRWTPCSLNCKTK